MEAFRCRSLHRLGPDSLTLCPSHSTCFANLAGLTFACHRTGHVESVVRSRETELCVNGVPSLALSRSAPTADPEIFLQICLAGAWHITKTRERQVDRFFAAIVTHRLA
jgi:hypothetical protein